MMMNVNPRLAHTLLSATAGSAVPESFNRPGLFSTGNQRLSSSANRPVDGCSNTNHTRLATATLVATVLEKIVRNTPMPLRYLSASTARPMPSSSPVGTVISASLIDTVNASWNCLLWNTVQ